MPRWHEEELVEKLKFEAGGSDSVELPDDMIITEVLLSLAITYDTGASPSPNEDAISRLLRAIRLRASATPPGTFVETDARLLKYLEYILSQGKEPYEDTLSSTASQSGLTVYALYKLHFGVFPERGKKDLSAVVPVPVFDDVNLEVVWGTESDLGNDYTISDAEITVIVKGLKISERENVKSIFPRGFAYPVWSVTEEDLSTTTYSNPNDKPINIPVGRIIRNAIIMSLDTSKDAKQNMINILEVYLRRVGAVIYRRTFSSLLREDYMAYKLPNVLTGVTLIEFKDIVGGAGLDMRRAKEGDVQFRVSTNATGFIRFGYFGYQFMR